MFSEVGQSQTRTESRKAGEAARLFSMSARVALHVSVAPFFSPPNSRIHPAHDGLTMPFSALASFPLLARNQSVHARRDVQQARILYNISRAVKTMDEAIADLNSSASPSIAQVARKYGLGRSTLSRRWRGVTTSKAQSVEGHEFPNENKEQELKNYV